MKIVVLKCGGSIVDQLPDAFFEMVATLKEKKGITPVIIHGGGPMISEKLSALNIPSTFINGLRVTTNGVLDVVEMVLSGSVNKQIVRKLSRFNQSIIGLSGIDGGLLKAVPVATKEQVGYVGEVTNVNTGLLKTLIQDGYTPVISPLATDESYQRYNVNADMAAAAIAKALCAPLLFISDIPGVLKDGEVLHQLSETEINTLMTDGTIYGGMIPKVNAAISALKSGAPEVAIMSGLNAQAVTDFIDGASVGTRFSFGTCAYV